jgi:hypothetical protein
MICSRIGCHEPRHERGLCIGHFDEALADLAARVFHQRLAARTTNKAQPTLVTATGEEYAPCPTAHLELVAQLIDTDAAALFRIVWRRIGEGLIAGVDPFPRTTVSAKG